MTAIIALLESAPAWLFAITGIVTAATALTALTPTKSDDKLLATVSKVLNLLALNIRHNKNADEASVTPNPPDAD